MKQIVYQVIVKTLEDLLQTQRKAVADLEAVYKLESDKFYQKYSQNIKSAIFLGSFTSAAIDSLLVIKTGLKHLSETGLQAIKHKNALAQVAQLQPSSNFKGLAYDLMVKAQDVSINAKTQAVKYAKSEYREVAASIVTNNVSPPSVGTAHYLSLGKGLKAEYEKSVDEFAIAIEQVFEDTSIETTLQMVITILDTIDLSKHAGTFAERYGESMVAQMDQERDIYMKRYTNQKNNLTRAVRNTEVALSALKKLGTTLQL